MAKNLIYYLEQIPDHREKSGLRHPLPIVLLVIIMAIISGHYGYRGIGRFLQRHRQSLIELLSIPNSRVPSYSTIRRVMMTLNYELLLKQFNDWIESNGILPSSEWVSIDGKALKNTVTNYSNPEQNFVNVVSAFSHQKGLVLGIKVNQNKEKSEIITVQELLEMLDLKGVVFTFDALHCQKKTLEIIVSKGNDYLVKVKANQPNLHKAIKQHTEEEKPLHIIDNQEKTRGRYTQRKVSIFSPPTTIDSKWPNVGCVIKVERFGITDEKPYHRIGYYISSLSPKSRSLAKGIRGHWLRENRLHWVKDVIFQEDKSPQKALYAPINLSVLKTWVLTLLRLHGFNSLTESISLLSHNLTQIMSFCT